MQHYWHKDIFSYVNYAEVINPEEDTAQFRTYPMKAGDTAYYSNGMLILEKVVANPVTERYSFTNRDTAIMAELKVVSSDGGTYKANPIFYLKNNIPQYRMDTVLSQGLAVGLSQIIDNTRIGISIKESSRMTPFIALKVLQFPFINLVWLGAIFMILGFGMSMARRIRMLK